MIKRLPFVARLKREEPMRSADRREFEEAANRIAGPTGWYAMSGWRPADRDCKLIGFATPLEAEEMQRWIDQSGIERRPPPPKYDGPMLSVGGYSSDDSGAR